MTQFNVHEADCLCSMCEESKLMQYVVQAERDQQNACDTQALAIRGYAHDEDCDCASCDHANMMREEIARDEAREKDTRNVVAKAQDGTPLFVEEEAYVDSMRELAQQEAHHKAWARAFLKADARVTELAKAGDTSSQEYEDMCEYAALIMNGAIWFPEDGDR